MTLSCNVLAQLWQMRHMFTWHIHIHIQCATLRALSFHDRVSSLHSYHICIASLEKSKENKARYHPICMS